MTDPADSTGARPGSRPVVQGLAVIGALAVGGWILCTNRAFYHDDAYITLRYAWNILHGNGPVWNVGERVQGYSNALQLALVTLLGAAGVDLVTASRAIGLLGFAAIPPMLWLDLRADHRGSPFRHLPVVFTVSSAPLIVWAIGGLGDTVYALIVSTGCLLLVATFDRPDRVPLFAVSGSCFGLSYVAHPDGLVFVGLAFLWLLATWRSRPLRSAVAFGVPCLLVMGAYVAAEYLYYGDIVPNPYYVKAANFSVNRLEVGAHYLAACVFLPPFLPIVVAATSVYGLATKRLRWNAKLGFLGFVATGYLGYLLYVGGDHMPALRLVLPLVVLLSALLFFLLDAMIEVPSRRAVVSINAAALLLIVLQVGPKGLNPRVPDPAAQGGTVVGRFIAKTWPKGSLIALNTAGSTPYYNPDDRFIDMLGLNDRHIARRQVDRIQLRWQGIPGHLKGDGAYVLSRKPDFIILGPSQGHAVSEPMFLSDLEIGRDPSFSTDYREHRVPLAVKFSNGREIVFVYYERTGSH